MFGAALASASYPSEWLIYGYTVYVHKVAVKVTFALAGRRPTRSLKARDRETGMDLHLRCTQNACVPIVL